MTHILHLYVVRLGKARNTFGWGTVERSESLKSYRVYGHLSCSCGNVDFVQEFPQ